jgi:hypothetical protein
MALDEFVDEFYLDHPDKMAQQRRLDNPPSVANHLIDAWIGAAGEHLAQRWGLRVELDPTRFSFRLAGTGFPSI